MRTEPVLSRFFASRARPISRHGPSIPAYLSQSKHPRWFELSCVCACRMSKPSYTQVSNNTGDVNMNIILDTHNPMIGLAILKGMLKCELLGMKRSRSPSAYSMVKKRLGFKGNRQSVYDQLCLYIEYQKRDYLLGIQEEAKSNAIH